MLVAWLWSWTEINGREEDGIYTDVHAGMEAVFRGLGWGGLAFAMGLQAFSRRGLSFVRALLFLGTVLGLFGGSSESLPLESCSNTI